ncbi:serine/threonine protein kinase [Candidatus Woesearchaeota archaeon]|nr:serine/threonine protein kinase [Candidatus Woesearchaeota archaeon]
MKMKIENFEVLETIGQGGFGTVYKAKNNLGQEYALKKIDDSLGDPFDEASAQLQHPNIVPVYEFFPESRVIQMEFMEGGSLANKLEQGPINYSTAIEITLSILEALATLHSRGHLHRDIKPSNILFGKSGTTKLSDFGLAVLIDEESNTDNLNSGVVTTTRSTICGTPLYMAPERLRGEEDCRSDLYSLGLVLREMITGERPEGHICNPSEINSDIPKELDKICAKSYATQIERRYQSAQEMAADLRDFYNNRKKDSFWFYAREAAAILTGYRFFQNIVKGSIENTITSNARKPLTLFDHFKISIFQICLDEDQKEEFNRRREERRSHDSNLIESKLIELEEKYRQNSQIQQTSLNEDKRKIDYLRKIARVNNNNFLVEKIFRLRETLHSRYYQSNRLE